ncbi:hypothetical protein BX600DRAFT_430706 [Xylariales sp. PMI_506]|nr:hypothetical protein BX600DRAFT_430706 [Xylariales sp. PMI_506]
MEDHAFPLFSHLPAELRLAIWELALPRRVFELREFTVQFNSRCNSEHIALCEIEPAVSLPPPSLAKVCQESRAVALRFGSARTIMASFPSRRMIHPKTDGIRRPGDSLRTWFDSSRDMLCLDSWTFWDSSNKGLMNKHIRQFGDFPHSLCLSLDVLRRSCKGPFMCEWASPEGIYSQVRQWAFYCDSITLHAGRSAQVAEVFGGSIEGSHTLLIDASDTVTIRRMAQLYTDESYPEYWQQPIADGLECISNAVNNSTYIQQAHMVLQDLWVLSREQMLRSGMVQDHIQPRWLTDLSGNNFLMLAVDHGQPWCQAILNEMPQFKLMIHFRLCTTNHDIK